MPGQNAEQDLGEKEKVTFRDLPHKRQLAVLTFARLAEPLVGLSLQVSVITTAFVQRQC